MAVTVEVIETGELGDRSYVAHDGEIAVVVDPQRDIDRITRVLDARELRCELVLETHVHNDYVSGGLELARRTGARYGVSSADEVAFDRLPVRDGDQLQAGQMRVAVLATPGHTDTHLAYRVDDLEGPASVYTGGGLLYGGVGRTDLLGRGRTEELTRAQFRSARRLVEFALDTDLVYPTHGFGSFCAAGPLAGAGGDTIAAQRRHNEALREPDEDAFVARMLSRLTEYPSYYAHMGARNRQGAGPVDLSPAPGVGAPGLRARIDAGEWVVDLRPRADFARAHLAGSIGIELATPFSTYLGWLIPWGSPLTLIGRDRDQLAEAQRQLVRIGIDRPAGAAVGTPAELAEPGRPRGYPRAGFAELAEANGRPEVVVLDVRRAPERALGHIPGSVHVPLHALPDRMAELPSRQLWVHCAGGYRASIAASLLDRAGHDVVLVDDAYPG